MNNNRIDDIWKKLLEVSEVQAQHGVILDQNTKDLQYHILRTNTLEDQVDKAMLPLTILKWSGAFLGVVGTIVGTIVAIQQLF